MRRLLFLLLTLLAVAALYAQPAKNAASGKIAYGLLQRSFAPGDSLTVSISLKKGPPFIISRVTRAGLDALAQNSDVIFISEVQIPREELNTGAYDLTLNGISYAHDRFPQLGGNGLHVSVKERLFDTTDIDLKQRVEITGLENNTYTPHASLMATIIAGGGNSSPFALGGAPQAIVSSSSFLNLLPDADAVMQRFAISVQNHSYGTVVENFYGNEAAAYDAQTNRFAYFLPVFSAGNSGDATSTGGPYSGVPLVANLTGNFKQAKNIITVGATDSSGQSMSLSSRGPAYDGRVKPELVAYGEDGSSGAAALASGTALLIQDAYRQAQSALPSSALVRAALINSADDNGTAHVDYTTGYGSLNAYKAVSTITEHHYFENAVAPNTTTSFTLTVPTGLSQLKLTLAWNDPAAVPNAAKALVNDLDLQLNFPATGESWKPWVLDPTPNAALLAAPAQRKVDTLNNAEQITLDAPAAGSYRMDVRGTHIGSGTQAFAIACQFDTANRFYWTYPTSTTTLLAGLAQRLRWQTDISGSGTIEYATSGNNWRTLGNVADLSVRSFRWSVPDTLTTVVIRVRTTGGIFYPSDTFTISPQLRPGVGFNCTDSFLLFWNKLPANRYRLYELQSRYLTPFAQIPDTAIFLSKTQHPSIFYAVAPIINGHEGIRSNSLNYPAQGTGCYIKSFFLDFQTATAAFFSAELGTLFSVAQLRFEKRTGSGFSTIATFDHPSSTLFSLADSSLSQGENAYRIAVRLANGNTIYSTIETVYFLPNQPVVVYPNPIAQGAPLHIIAGEAGRYTVQFLDANGRLLRQLLLNGNLTDMDTRKFPQGLYFLRILDQKHFFFAQKLVIF